MPARPVVAGRGLPRPERRKAHGAGRDRRPHQKRAGRATRLATVCGFFGSCVDADRYAAA
ncbi:hypothetical protein EF917_07395 [Streptomyces sp. WAC00469]|nr:hypothetical protein EF917_07395 [Streptomyces sp. WAC00469]